METPKTFLGIKLPKIFQPTPKQGKDESPKLSEDLIEKYVTKSLARQFPAAVLESLEPVQLKQTLPPGINRAGQIADNSSEPSNEVYFFGMSKNLRYENTPYNRDLIPLIKNLAKYNPDVSQMVQDLTQLANTGFKVRFDPKVNPDTVDKMRAHLDKKLKYWGYHKGGSNGIINRIIRQILVSGAVSGEWVPEKELKGIKKLAFVRPETIHYAYNQTKEEWVPYQEVSWQNHYRKRTPNEIGLQKLNENTYRYISLMADDDTPYGIPPILSALEALSTQKDMVSNIKYIVKQLGIVGFMQALLDKEDKKPDESVGAYKSRMESLLSEASERLKISLRDGISVGFKDDIEFEFHSPTKSVSGADKLFIQNEELVASGLKIDPSMLGRGYSTSEGQITIVFNKLLSQLKNVQNCAREFLEYGFKLELLMAGYSFDYLEVTFNPSTISDDLKIQQAAEIKIRNVIAKYNQGIIDNDQVADELGYEKANRREPRVMMDPSGQAQKDQKREKDKDASDRKNRKKKKPQEDSQK